MLKRILLIAAGALVLGIATVLCLALTKSDEFVVQRSTVISAPPEKIYAIISNFHRSNEWSPWEKLDPNMKRTISGSESGKGAKYEWSGNADAGEGSMEIIDEDPPKKVQINLHFIKPMEGDSLIVYELVPQNDSTKMTWTMSGPNTFFGKVMQVFMSCDAMIGKSFEEGLANLKAACEK